MLKLKILGNSIYFGFLAIILYGCYHNYFTWCSTIYSISLASFLRFVFLPADCDMILRYYEYFGKNVDSLDGEVIWITGASSGIGEALALSLAKGKVKLALSARSEDLLHKVKERCIEIGSLDSEDVLVVPFDMTDYDKHESAFSTVLKHFGKLDILVSNAGRSQRAKWEHIETSVDEALFSLNAFALLRLARLATLHFISVGGGSHVVMSSVAGKMGVPMSASYTGSKHALMGYFECLRAERGSQGITITLLCPGPVQSGLMDRILMETLDQKSDKTRKGKMMTSQRCAELSVVAMVNRVSEAWICYQPALIFMYLTQYQPTLVRWFMNNFDFGAIFMKVRDGHSTQTSPQN